MPATFEYDRGQHILYTVIEDVVSAAELQDLLTSIHHSPHFPADTPTITDLRRMDFSGITTNVLTQLVEFERRLGVQPAKKLAIVTGSAVGYGLSRVYQTLSSRLPKTTKVFEDMGEAQRWILGQWSQSDQAYG